MLKSEGFGISAIAPLTSAHLQRRIIPGLRTLGEIAEHIVFGRALHLHRTLGERAAELTPLLRWEDADDPPHTAAEIVQGLELTWQFITACLMRGSPTSMPSHPSAASPTSSQAAHSCGASMLCRTTRLPSMTPRSAAPPT